MSTQNVFGADNQQERLKMIGWIVGFSDGEGCFSVSIVRNKTSSIGWQVMPEFVITQGKSSLDSLLLVKKFFECGNVFLNKRYDDHTEDLCRYCVRSINDLSTIIVPFFTSNSLKTCKCKDFLFFSKIMNLIRQRKHLTSSGMKEIALLASQMNRRKSRSFLESSETIR